MQCVTRSASWGRFNLGRRVSSQQSLGSGSAAILTLTEFALLFRFLCAAFIEMEDLRDAEDAIRALDGFKGWVSRVCCCGRWCIAPSTHTQLRTGLRANTCMLLPNIPFITWPCTTPTMTDAFRVPGCRG